MSLTIDLREYPERSRIVSEVEFGGFNIRRLTVATPATGNVIADLDTHMAEVKNAIYQMQPELRPEDQPATYSAQIGDPATNPSLTSMPPAPVWVPDVAREDVRRGPLDDGPPGDHTMSPQRVSEEQHEHMRGAEGAADAEERTAEAREGPAATAAIAPEMNITNPPLPPSDEFGPVREEPRRRGRPPGSRNRNTTE